MNQIDLSFVIPACNEEDSIETSLFNLDGLVKRNSLTYEIIVVDDGSRDRTLPRAVEYASKNGHVKVVSYALNEGKGYAIRRGFLQTEGDIVIFADGDMEIDFNQVSSYIQALERADIVIASKWHSQSNVEVPLLRKVLSRSFNVLVRLLTGVTLRDTQAGLKAIRRSAFEDVFQMLAVKRYAFDVELLAVANLYGLRIVEMPVQLKMNGRFKLKEMWQMLIDLFGIVYRLRIRRFYQKLRYLR